MPSTPVPLPYHRAIVEHLQAEEQSLWQWFTSSDKRKDEGEGVRLDLLKSTYRLESQAQPELYGLANEVRERMGLQCSLTLYQAQTSNSLNASLAYLPGEAHVVLAGPVASVLSENELRAVFAHELAHFLFFEMDGGANLIAADLLRAMAADAGGIAAAESARLHYLWTEIYADRWACHVSEDTTAAIAALIKIETGVNQVNAESYLRQADEIFAKGNVTTDHFSHPETYIRARALKLWAEQADDAQPEIERMIEGGLNLNRLDLLAQRRAAKLTRHFIQQLLLPQWFRTEAVLAHARQFFADFDVDAQSVPDGSIERELKTADSSLCDYLCYLMLDFVTVDRELGDVALAAALIQARRLGIHERFAELAQKELSLGKKAFAKIDKGAETLIARTEAAL